MYLAMRCSSSGMVVITQVVAPLYCQCFLVSCIYASDRVYELSYSSVSISLCYCNMDKV